MIEIRKLAGDECAAALEMASRIFWEEQEIPPELCPIPDEALPIWWGALEDGVLLGTMASYVEEGARHLGRMTVADAARGKGVGTKLMVRSLADLFAEGAPEVFMDCRDASARIVLRLGGRATGEPRPFYKGNCTTMAITKEEFENRK